MIERRTLEKYWAFIPMAFKNELRYWPILVGRMAFFGILLIVFSRLWQVAAQSGMKLGASTSEMLWYLAATEWIVLSTPAIHTSIEEDVRDGSFAYFLSRPLSYMTMRVVESVGKLIVRLLAVGIMGFTLTWFIAGELPQISYRLPIFILCGVGAGIVILLFQATIGVCALWIQESTPLYWLWQKFLFILGGLMLPLTIYPEWLQKIAYFFPFYALLYGPGRLMIRYNHIDALETLVLLVGWGAVALIVLNATQKRALKSITIDGG